MSAARFSLNPFERVLLWSAVILGTLVLLLRFGTAIVLWYLHHAG